MDALVIEEETQENMISDSGHVLQRLQVEVSALPPTSDLNLGPLVQSQEWLVFSRVLWLSHLN